LRLNGLRAIEIDQGSIDCDLMDVIDVATWRRCEVAAWMVR